MIKFIKSFFSKKEEVTAEVPYKVEVPVVSTVSNQAVEAVVESMAPAKKPAAKKVPAKKTAAKKPRHPKAAK
jgi:hypothetical protein